MAEAEISRQEAVEELIKRHKAEADSIKAILKVKKIHSNNLFSST